MSDDELQAAAYVADMDQFCEQMARTAQAAVAYFNGLLQGGFTRKEALGLTKDWADHHFSAQYAASYGFVVDE